MSTNDTITPLRALVENAFLNAAPIDPNEVRETSNDIVKDDCRAGEIIRRIRALIKKSVSRTCVQTFACQDTTSASGRRGA